MAGQSGRSGCQQQGKGGKRELYPASQTVLMCRLDVSFHRSVLSPQAQRPGWCSVSCGSIRPPADTVRDLCFPSADGCQLLTKLERAPVTRHRRASRRAGRECARSRESQARSPRNQPDRCGTRIDARARLVAVLYVRCVECLYGGDRLPSAEEVKGEGRRNAITPAKGRCTRGRRDERDDCRRCVRRTAQSLGGTERATDVRVLLPLTGGLRMNR